MHFSKQEKKKFREAFFVCKMERYMHTCTNRNHNYYFVMSQSFYSIQQLHLQHFPPSLFSMYWWYQEGRHMVPCSSYTTGPMFCLTPPDHHHHHRMPAKEGHDGLASLGEAVEVAEILPVSGSSKRRLRCNQCGEWKKGHFCTAKFKVVDGETVTMYGTLKKRKRE